MKDRGAMVAASSTNDIHARARSPRPFPAISGLRGRNNPSAGLNRSGLAQQSGVPGVGGAFATDDTAPVTPVRRLASLPLGGG